MHIESTKQWISYSYLATGLGFIGTLIILSLITINQSLVTTGQLISAGETFYIRHHQNYDLIKSLVQKGDHVREGDPLFIFDTQSLQVTLSTLNSKLKSIASTKNRLTDEIRIIRKCLNEKNLNGTTIRHWIHQETRNFKSFQEENSYTDDQLLLSSRMEKIIQSYELLSNEKINHKNSMATHKKRITLIDKKLRLLREDIHAANNLLEKGMQSKNNLRMINQQALDLQMKRNELVLHTENVSTLLSRADYNIRQLLPNALEERLFEFNNIEKEYNEVFQKIEQVHLKITSATVLAPTTGWIIGVRSTQSNLTIAQGEVLAKIISEGKLKAVISIPAHRRNQVQIGQEAIVRISTGKGPRAIEHHGKVTYISASTLSLKKNETSAYEAHINLEEKPIANESNNNIEAGMPITASIIGDKYSIIAYLLHPIKSFVFETFQ